MMSTQMKPTLKEFLQVQQIIESGAECPEELKAVYEGIFDMFRKSKPNGTKKTLSAQELAQRRKKDALLTQAAKQAASSNQGSYGTTKPGFENSNNTQDPLNRVPINRAQLARLNSSRPQQLPNNNVGRITQVVSIPKGGVRPNNLKQMWDIDSEL